MKKRTRIGFGIIASAAVILSAAAWAHTAGVFAAPTAVAVVDFDELQKDLDEQNALLLRLQTKFKPMADEIVQMTGEMQALVTKLEEGAATMTEAEKRELTLEGMLLEQRVASSKDILQLAQTAEAHAVMQDLYPKIYDAIAQVAQEGGWDLVLLDTSKIIPWTYPNLEGMNNAVARRSMLYVSPNVDITKDVLTLLNNNFANPPAPVQAIPEN